MKLLKKNRVHNPKNHSTQITGLERLVLFTSQDEKSRIYEEAARRADEDQRRLFEQTEDQLLANAAN